MNALAELLSSRVKAEVCRVLFGPFAVELHLRELARRTGCTFSAVQRELAKLERIGLVERRKDGNRTCFRADPRHPFYGELRGLVRKSSGLVTALSEALKNRRIKAAFVFGSVASGDEKPGSDVDLLVIGTVQHRTVAGGLFEVSQQMGREINPHVIGPAEFAKRLRAKDHFLTTIMQEPKLFVIGNQDELERLAG